MNLIVTIDLYFDNDVHTLHRRGQSHVFGPAEQWFHFSSFRLEIFFMI